MALVSKKIPNLINGVSQQPPALRLPSQAETQENGLSDIVDGLKKRPPVTGLNNLKVPDSTYVEGTNLVDSSVVLVPLSESVLSSSYIHTYKRSTDEQYTVIYEAGQTTPRLNVFDINGNLRHRSGIGNWDNAGASLAIPTDDSNGDKTDSLATQQAALQAYFGTAAAKDIQTTTVADYSFMVNTKKVVAKDTSSATGDALRPWEGLFYFKSMAYISKTQAYVRDNPVSGGNLVTSGHVYTFDGSESEEGITLRTGLAADHISGRATHNGAYATDASNNSLTSQMSFSGNYVRGGAISQPFFTVSNAVDNFNITITDDNGGRNAFAHKDAVASFTTLPKFCDDGFVIQVNGDNQKKEDDFYVRFTGSNTSGTWKECAQPSRPSQPVYHNLDNTTMPHTLSQNSNGSFTFSSKVFDERKCGDEETNPFPSFVGQSISNIFFHRNRLGFISGENVIFSEANGYFNFFRVTVRSLLDSAPIDIAISQDEVADLKQAVPSQKALLLFTDLSQFTLSSETLLTASEVSIELGTKFDCDLNVAPVSSGTSVFFATRNGDFSGLREYRIEAGSDDTADAPSITAHIPKYIKGGIKILEASSNNNTVLVVGDDDESKMYVYRHHEIDKERVQSSWSTWTFDHDICHAYFNNDVVYLIFKNGIFGSLSLKGVKEQTRVLNIPRTHSVETLNTIPKTRDQYGTEIFDTRHLPLVPATIASYDNFQYVGWNNYNYMHNNSGEAYEIKLSQAYVYTSGTNSPSGRVWFKAGTFNDAEGNFDASLAPSFVTFSQGSTSIKYELNPDTWAEVGNHKTFSHVLNNNYCVAYNGVAGALPPTTPDAFMVVDGQTRQVATWWKEFVNNTTHPQYSIFDYPPKSVTFTTTDSSLLDYKVTLDSNDGFGAITTLADVQNRCVSPPNADTEFVSPEGTLIAKGISTEAIAKVVAYLGAAQEIDGAAQDNTLIVGQPYVFKYELSEQVFTPTAGDTTDLGRFQLRNITFSYSDANKFDVTVDTPYRDAKVTKFTGRILGDINNTLGYSVQDAEGDIRVGVAAKAEDAKITITNPYHNQAIFQHAEWEGLVHLRNKRI